MQPIVLLPGLMCARDAWEHQIAALSDLAEPLVMEWAVEHDSLDAMAEATLAAAPRRFALAGHSMGGRVALEIYRRAPERVLRLALLDTGAGPLPEGEAGLAEERGRRDLLAIARTSGIRAMATEWLKGMLPPSRFDDAELSERVVRMFERKDADVFNAQIVALLRRPDARPVLGKIQCPTLVLTGEEDRWSPPASHQEIADAITGSSLVLVPQCGHMSTMERPDDVSQAMREWLLRDR